MKTGTGNERGSVTILIALLSAVILALGIGFNWLVKEHLQNSAGLQDKAEAILRARSAYDALIYILLTGRLTENEVRVAQGGITELRAIPLDGSEVEIFPGVYVRTQDSNGRVSLLSEDQEPLRRLVGLEAGPAAGRVVAASYLDWVDRDDLPRANGAEAPYYRSRALPEPRNYAVQYPEELALVRGVGEELYRRIAPYLTILPRRGFNPNTAGKTVLQAVLDIDAAKAERIRDQVARSPVKSLTELSRLAGKAIERTDTEGWFEPSSDIDIVVRVGRPRSLYTISAGLTVGSGILYPCFIHYWREE